MSQSQVDSVDSADLLISASKSTTEVLKKNDPVVDLEKRLQESERRSQVIITQLENNKLYLEIQISQEMELRKKLEERLSTLVPKIEEEQREAILWSLESKRQQLEEKETQLNLQEERLIFKMSSDLNFVERLKLESIDLLKKEKTHWQHQLTSFRSENQALKSQVDEMLLVIEALKQNNRTIVSKLQDSERMLREEVESERRQNAVLIEQFLASGERSSHELSMPPADENSSSFILSRDHQPPYLMQQLESERVKLSVLREQFEKLQRSKELIETENFQLRSQNLQIQSDREKQLQKTIDMSNQVRALAHEIDRFKSDCSELQSSLSAEREEMLKQQQEMQSLQQSLFFSDQQLEAEKQLSSSLVRQLESEKSFSVSLQTTIEQLQKQKQSNFGPLESTSSYSQPLLSEISGDITLPSASLSPPSSPSSFVTKQLFDEAQLTIQLTQKKLERGETENYHLTQQIRSLQRTVQQNQVSSARLIEEKQQSIAKLQAELSRIESELFSGKETARSLQDLLQESKSTFKEREEFFECETVSLNQTFQQQAKLWEGEIDLLKITCSKIQSQLDRERQLRSQITAQFEQQKIEQRKMQDQHDQILLSKASHLSSLSRDLENERKKSIEATNYVRQQQINLDELQVLSSLKENQISVLLLSLEEARAHLDSETHKQETANATSSVHLTDQTSVSSADSCLPSNITQIKREDFLAQIESLQQEIELEKKKAFDFQRSLHLSSQELSTTKASLNQTLAENQSLQQLSSHLKREIILCQNEKQTEAKLFQDGINKQNLEILPLTVEVNRLRATVQALEEKCRTLELSQVSNQHSGSGSGSLAETERKQLKGQTVQLLVQLEAVEGQLLESQLAAQSKERELELLKRSLENLSKTDQQRTLDLEQSLELSRKEIKSLKQSELDYQALLAEERGRSQSLSARLQMTEKQVHQQFRDELQDRTDQIAESSEKIQQLRKLVSNLEADLESEKKAHQIIKQHFSALLSSSTKVIEARSLAQVEDPAFERKEESRDLLSVLTENLIIEKRSHHTTKTTLSQLQENYEHLLSEKQQLLQELGFHLQRERSIALEQEKAEAFEVSMQTSTSRIQLLEEQNGQMVQQNQANQQLLAEREEKLSWFVKQLQLGQEKLLSLNLQLEESQSLLKIESSERQTVEKKLLETLARFSAIHEENQNSKFELSKSNDQIQQLTQQILELSSSVQEKLQAIQNLQGQRDDLNRKICDQEIEINRLHKVAERDCQMEEEMSSSTSYEFAERETFKSQLEKQNDLLIRQLDKEKNKALLAIQALEQESLKVHGLRSEIHKISSFQESRAGNFESAITLLNQEKEVLQKALNSTNLLVSEKIKAISQMSEETQARENQLCESISELQVRLISLQSSLQEKQNEVESKEEHFREEMLLQQDQKEHLKTLNLELQERLRQQQSPLNQKEEIVQQFESETPKDSRFFPSAVPRDQSDHIQELRMQVDSFQLLNASLADRLRRATDELGQASEKIQLLKSQLDVVKENQHRASQIHSASDIEPSEISATSSQLSELKKKYAALKIQWSAALEDLQRREADYQETLTSLSEAQQENLQAKQEKLVLELLIEEKDQQIKEKSLILEKQAFESSRLIESLRSEFHTTLVDKDSEIQNLLQALRQTDLLMNQQSQRVRLPDLETPTIDQLMIENQHSKKHSQDLERLIAHKTTEIEALQHSISELSSRLLQSESTTNSMQQEIVRVCSACDQKVLLYVEEIENVQNRILSLQDDLQRLKSAEQSTDDNLQEALIALARETAIRENVENQLKIQQQLVENNSKINQDHIQQIQHDMSLEKRQLLTELDHLQKERTQLLAEKSLAETSVNRLQKVVLDLEHLSSSERNQLSSSILSLSLQLENEMLAHKRTAEDREECLISLGLQTEMSSVIDTLQAEKKQIQHMFDTSTLEQQEWRKAQLKERQKLEQELENSKQELELLRTSQSAMYTGLQAQNQTLQGQLSQTQKELETRELQVMESISALESSLENQQQSIQVANEEMRERGMEINNLKQWLAQSQSECKDLYTKVAESQSQFLQVQQQASVLEVSHHELQMQVISKDRELQDALILLSQLNSHHHLLNQKTSEENEKRVLELQQSLQELQSRNQFQQQTNAQLQIQIKDSLEKERLLNETKCVLYRKIEEMQQSVSVIDREANQRVESKFIEMQKTIDNLTILLEQREEIVKSLQHSHTLQEDRKTQADIAIGKIKFENEKLRNHILDIEQQLALSEKHLSDLEKQLSSQKEQFLHSSNQDMLSHVSSLEKHFQQQYEAKFQVLQRENNQLVKQVEALNKKLSTNNTEITTLRGQVEKLSATLAITQDESQKTSDLFLQTQKNNRQLQVQLREFEDKLELQLQQKRFADVQQPSLETDDKKKVTELEVELRTKEESIQTLCSTLEAERLRVLQLDKQINELISSEKSVLAHELSQLRLKNQQLATSINEMEERKIEQAVEISHLKKEKTDLSEANLSLQQQVEKLGPLYHQLEVAENEKSLLLNKVQLLQSNLSHTGLLMDQLKQLNEEQRQQLSQVQKEKHDLKNSNAELSYQLSELSKERQEERTQMQKQMQKQQWNIERHQRQINGLKKAVEEDAQKNQSLILYSTLPSSSGSSSIRKTQSVASDPVSDSSKEMELTPHSPFEADRKDDRPTDSVRIEGELKARIQEQLLQLEVQKEEMQETQRQLNQVNLRFEQQLSLLKRTGEQHGHLQQEFSQLQSEHQAVLGQLRDSQAQTSLLMQQVESEKQSSSSLRFAFENSEKQSLESLQLIKEKLAGRLEEQRVQHLSALHQMEEALKSSQERLKSQLDIQQQQRLQMEQLESDKMELSKVSLQLQRLCFDSISCCQSFSLSLKERLSDYLTELLLFSNQKTKRISKLSEKPLSILSADSESTLKTKLEQLATESEHLLGKFEAVVSRVLPHEVMSEFPRLPKSLIDVLANLLCSTKESDELLVTVSERIPTIINQLQERYEKSHTRIIEVEFELEKKKKESQSAESELLQMVSQLQKQLSDLSVESEQTSSRHKMVQEVEVQLLQELASVRQQYNETKETNDHLERCLAEEKAVTLQNVQQTSNLEQQVERLIQCIKILQAERNEEDQFDLQKSQYSLDQQRVDLLSLVSLKAMTVSVQFDLEEKICSLSEQKQKLEVLFVQLLAEKELYVQALESSRAEIQKLLTIRSDLEEQLLQATIDRDVDRQIFHAERELLVQQLISDSSLLSSSSLSQPSVS